MGELTNRQTGIILSIAIISLKFLSFPAIMSRYTGNNVYIAVTISVAIDIFFLVVVISAMKKCPNQTFFQIIESGIGKVLARVITSLLFVYFLFKTVVSIKATHSFFLDLLFEDFSWYFFIIPLLLLFYYIVNKPLKTYGRSAEFFYGIVVVGALITFLLPLRNLNLINLLPVFPDGISPILKGVFYTCFNFGDYLVLLIFMGRFKYDSKSAKTLYKYGLLTELFLVIFVVVFVMIFDNLVVNQSMAVSDIPLNSNVPSINGRLDWLSIIIWTIMLIFESSLMLICSYEMLSYTICVKKKNIALPILMLLLLGVMFIFYRNLGLIIKITVSKPFAIVVCVIQVIVPLVLWACAFVRKKNEENIQKIVGK